ncbi:Hypothetical protein FKW44_020170, partial [Caligus rogercresseyi]
MTEQAPNTMNLSSLYLRLPNPNYELLRIMRFELMREVQQKKTQTKISDFFKAGPSPAEKRSRTESETSSVSVTSTSSTNLPICPAA